MAGFVYYIPEKRRDITLDELKSIGLGYAFDDRFTPAEVMTGPAQKPGVVVVDDKTVPGALIGYYETKQRWMKSPFGEFWVGHDKQRTPAPEDLERETMLPGHLVGLGDGNKWTIPIGRGFAEVDGELGYYQAVPQRYVLSESGEWILGDVVLRYESLWKLACGWFDRWRTMIDSPETGEGWQDWTGREKADAATETIATNYRIGPVEIELLKLFDELSVTAILDAVIDLPSARLLEAKKKGSRAADGSSTADGQAD